VAPGFPYFLIHCIALPFDLRSQEPNKSKGKKGKPGGSAGGSGNVGAGRARATGAAGIVEVVTPDKKDALATSSSGIPSPPQSGNGNMAVAAKFATSCGGAVLEPTGVGAASAAAIGGTPGGPAKQGRPETPLDVLADQKWQKFITADHTSSFFGSKAESESRSLARFAGMCGSKVTAHSKQPLIAKLFRRAQKQMQIIINAIDMHVKWTKRKTLQQGAAQFKRSWESLMSFCCGTDAFQDAIQFQCPFLVDTYLQALMISNDDWFATALITPSLKSVFSVDDDDTIGSRRAPKGINLMLDCLCSCWLDVSGICFRVPT